MKKVVVFDVETLAGCFTYTDKDINTGEINVFVIHPELNEYRKLLAHLTTLSGMIGFNNLNFDYPVIHSMIENKTMWLKLTPEQLIYMIYDLAQETIQRSNAGEWVVIPDNKTHIPQCDLFKIWHYDNRAKQVSLKALQCSLNWPNVQEMPIHHSEKNISLEQLEEIKGYNLNDVESTHLFYQKTKEFGKIELRKQLKNQFQLPCTNWSNGKIGERLILKFYCEITGRSPDIVRELRSFRSHINLAECIPQNVSFKHNIFKELCSKIENTTITNTKGELSFTVVHKEHIFDYGTGGLHGIAKAGVYESNENKIIKSLDVASLYPNLPIVLNVWPEHLGEEFLKVYREKIVNVRMREKAKPKELRNNTVIDGYKEAANIPYGKSMSEYSFMYDPLYAMKTTIGGQLYITMLCEALQEIPGSLLLTSNTDGCEILIDREYEGLYKEICKDWEKITKLTLEFKDYKKMWIRDVNSYGSVDMDNKIKNKGAFEIEKKIGDEPAYHKNNSFKVIPTAIQEYFLNRTPIEKTITEHKEIYDFCGRYKFRGSDYGEIHDLNGKKKIQKVCRYYISDTNNCLFKISQGKIKKTAIQRGFSVTEFNKYVEKPIEDYKIDYKFYIEKAREIIEQVENKQYNLFG